MPSFSEIELHEFRDYHINYNNIDNVAHSSVQKYRID